MDQPFWRHPVRESTDSKIRTIIPPSSIDVGAEKLTENENWKSWSACASFGPPFRFVRSPLVDVCRAANTMQSRSIWFIECVIDSPKPNQEVTRRNGTRLQRLRPRTSNSHTFISLFRSLIPPHIFLILSDLFGIFSLFSLCRLSAVAYFHVPRSSIWPLRLNTVVAHVCVCLCVCVNDTNKQNKKSKG